MKIENLRKFCSEEIEKLAEPWSTEKYTYASNGHLIIRIPRMNDIPERKNAPQIEGTSIGESFNYNVDKWYPVPKIELPKTANCLSCEGSGEITKCPHCGYNLPIEYGKCSDCKGSGSILYHKSVEINGVFFSNIYLYDIGKLENVEIAPRGFKEATQFRFNGGDGLLMPRSQ